ncbi:hypothetical protein [Pseudomonas alkylphenolica]|nr:hypothetical protein [Pseudomonas alkylphenolica]MBH3430000.1 hypothetical protein [Pseudomonas alkylphenolica]
MRALLIIGLGAAKLVGAVSIVPASTASAASVGAVHKPASYGAIFKQF